MLTAFISSKIFYDILRCRLRRGGLKCKEKRANGNLPDPLLSSFRSLNEQRPTVPKEGRTSLEHLLRKQNEFVYKLITFISSASHSFLFSSI